MRGIFFSLILLLAACDTATEPEYGEAGNRRTIASVQALCDHRQRFDITEDITIRGRVTANDRFGEFVHKLIVEDATGGLEIAAEGERLADRYPFGCEVDIHCNGLTLCEYGGKIVLGYGTSEFGAGRISERDIDRFIRPRLPEGDSPTPQRIGFAEVSMRHVDCYVQLDNVTLPDGGCWCRRDTLSGDFVTTEHRMVDDAGRELTLRVAATVSYAKEPLPEGKGSICGIVDYFAGRFSLRPTNHNIDFD